MTTKKSRSTSKAAKKAGSKKAGGATSEKRDAKKSKYKSSPGIISRVTKVAGEVLWGAAAGAAKGAVAGAAEAGAEATGIGQTAKVGTKDKSTVKAE